jgi:sortase A
VLDPVPGRPEEVPTQALLTLTTAEDLVTTPDRAVGFGTLTKTETP